jgi:3-hydroxyacyl-[acyl-carrier-protein] dehydratase
MAANVLASAVTVLESSDSHVVTAMEIDQDDPIFAGHYPGFPIYPGVCLVECVHQSALEAGRRRDRPVRLAAVESARFRNPAYPGSRVITRATFTEGDGCWRCSATLHRDDVSLAVVRLRLDYVGGTS